MRGAVIHGILLAIMLVYGYRTWTRDKTVEPNIGSVVLWDKAEADLVSIEYTTDKKIVKIERRDGGASGAYWWGTDTTIEKKTVKPPEPPKPANGAGSGSGSGSAAGSGAGSGSGSAAAGSAAGSGAGSNAVAAGSGAGSGSAKAGSAAGSNAGSAVAAGSAAGSGSAKVESGAGSGSSVAAGSGAGSGSAGAGSSTGSGSNVAAGSGSGSGSAVAAGSGSAGSGAGSGSDVVAKTEPPKEIEERKTHEFPLGDTGDKLIKSYTAARALRELGTPSDKEKTDYKLAESKSKIVVTFKDGKHTFTVGGPVYGTADKYVLDEETNKAYVLSKDLISALEVGESSLHLTDPRGFDATKIDSAAIAVGDRVKNAARVMSDKEGTSMKTWGDAETKKADATLGNFLEAVGNLRPTEYAPNVKISDLASVLTITYKDAKGGTLGTLALYKREKLVPIPEGEVIDPAAPPKTETEYYLVTERTRVPGLVRKDTAQRTEQDIPVVFGDKPAPPPTPPPGMPKPGSNPFGNVPIPPHGGSAHP